MKNPVYRILGKRGRITIPFEIRKHLGFAYNDILSFTESDDGRTVIVKREKICDECQGKCNEDITDSVTLQDFLDGLSFKEQQAALVHLSLRWAERKEVNQDD